MITFRFRTALALAVSAALFTVSCKEDKDDPKPTGYDVPTTYSFTNVNYSGQTARLGMMTELVTYVKTANTPGTQLDATKLHNMLTNTGNPFADASLNTSGKQLRDKLFSLDQAYFDMLLDSVAAASKSSTAGSNGVAGVVFSNDNTKKYLFDRNGFDCGETVEKGFMGSLVFYQIAGVYLSEDKIGNGIDNTTVTPGQGTTMEHHWDEAFGYFGVPTDFPANLNGLSFVAKYCNSRNAQLGCNKIIMDAYLKGRAAISNKDMATKDAQALIIKDQVEKVFAATAVSYLNKAKAALTDNAIRNHALSEGMGFIRALKYNPGRKISDAQWNQVIGYIGGNLYNVSASNLDAAKDLLSSIYGLDDIKNTL